MTNSDVTAADVMVRHPKTLSVDATVADAQRALENTSVKMLLLVDGDRFYGAVTAVPADADVDQLVLAFVDEAPITVTPDVPAAEAIARLRHKPNGRVIVLEDERLVGLV